MARPHLTDAISKLTAFLQERPEVVFAYLHGSALERPDFNDLDVAVYVNPAAVVKDKALDYEMAVGVELEMALRFPVDVRVLNYVPSYFAYHACKGKLLFCRDQRSRYDFIEAVWREYFDYLPYARAYLRDVLGLGQQK